MKSCTLRPMVVLYLGLSTACPTSAAQTAASDASAGRAPSAAHEAPELRRRFLELSRAASTNDAIAAGVSYLKVNPWDGEVWYELAVAQLLATQYEPAIAGFRKAHDLGVHRTDALYNISCALALSGRSDAALDALQDAMEAGYVASESRLQSDHDLDSIRSHPRFSRITGVGAPADLSRDDRWRYDIDFFKRRLEQVHAHLFRIMKRDWFEAQIADLQRDAPTLSDIDVQLRLQTILAAVGDGHTKMQLPRDMVRSLPVRLYDYADGLFVQAATVDHRDLVGCRVLRIGNASAEEALRAVRPLVSHDNEQGIRQHAPELLAYYDVLRFVGLADDSSTVPVRVATASGDERTVDLALITLPQPRWNWVWLRDLDGGEIPLYLQHQDELLHFEFLPQDRIAYLRIWAISNGPAKTFARFAESAFDFIAKNDVAAMVIDLRLNRGGNDFLNRAVVHRALRCEEVSAPGKLFVIADRTTFSAAMGLLTDLEYQTDALIVGEPARARPNGFGESTRITLPCSKATLTCSSLYHQRSYSQDSRTLIAPDLPAELTSDDDRNNRDPSLDAIRSYLGARHGESKRNVRDHVLTSLENPALRIRVDKSLQFVGTVPFRIRDIASGERFVFVEARDKTVTRLVIAQFESMLPTTKETYNYSFDDAPLMAGYRFRRNPFAFSNDEARRENPTGEAALTAAFLHDRGYVVDDELMCIRYLTVPDAERRCELIVFYLEPLSPSGARLSELYSDDGPTPKWKSLAAELEVRAKQALEIMPLRTAPAASAPGEGTRSPQP